MLLIFFKPQREGGFFHRGNGEVFVCRIVFCLLQINDVWFFICDLHASLFPLCSRGLHHYFSTNSSFPLWLEKLSRYYGAALAFDDRKYECKQNKETTTSH